MLTNISAPPYQTLAGLIRTANQMGVTMCTPVLALLAATAIVAPATASAATIIDGTLGAAIVGVLTNDNTKPIGAGTTFTNIFTFVSGTGKQFSVVPVGITSPITLSAVTATKNTAVNFSSSFGSFLGTINTVDVQSATGSAAVKLTSLGTFTPLGALSGYVGGPASLTFTFNQTGGAGATVSGSFTLASPPVASAVPEPGVWVMMISGAGLVGAAARRRRKKPSADA